tara:strand:- start:68 stop:316 length:249 start_codon:yes stop_codon:yes gene_type:complete
MQERSESNPTNEAQSGQASIGVPLNTLSNAASAPPKPATEAGENIRIHIVLDDVCLSKLKRACDDNERTTSAQIRYLIRNHL